MRKVNGEQVDEQEVRGRRPSWSVNPAKLQTCGCCQQRGRNLSHGIGLHPYPKWVLASHANTSLFRSMLWHVLISVTRGKTWLEPPGCHLDGRLSLYICLLYPFLGNIELHVDYQNVAFHKNFLERLVLHSPLISFAKWSGCVRFY